MKKFRVNKTTPRKARIRKEVKKITDQWDSIVNIKRLLFTLIDINQEMFNNLSKKKQQEILEKNESFKNILNIDKKDLKIQDKIKKMFRKERQIKLILDK